MGSEIDKAWCSYSIRRGSCRGLFKCTYYSDFLLQELINSTTLLS